MPPAERPPVLVWRRGEALLAVEVDSVLEIARTDAPAGTADDEPVRTRGGVAPVLNLPGLPRERAARAVILTTDAGLVALPADAVEGIRAMTADRFASAPEWLQALAPDHVRGIVTLDDDRLAALLAVDALRPGP